MLKSLLKFSFLFAFVSLTLLTSCNKEDTDELNLENVSEEDLQDTQIFTAIAFSNYKTMQVQDLKDALN